jgi:hypothetical protein
MKRVTVAVVIMAAAWLLVLGVPGQGAAQYLGETTWTATITQNEHGAVTPPKTFTLTGSLTRMGGVYYTMQGYVNVPDDGPFILSGGGALIGNTLYLTLSTSQRHTTETWRDSSVWHVELAKATLNGTFYEVYHGFDTASMGPTPSFDNGFSAGTVTRTGPVINLTPTGAGAQTLLLLDNN